MRRRPFPPLMCSGRRFLLRFERFSSKIRICIHNGIHVLVAKMPTEVAAQSSIGNAPTAPRPPHSRSRISNHPRRMAIDGRSQLGRRVRDFAENFAVQLGGWAALSDAQEANVRRAAELTALAEQARAEALRTGNVDPLGLVRLDGAANRAVRALYLDRKRPPASPTLSEYLAGLNAREPEETSDDVLGSGVAAGDETQASEAVAGATGGSENEVAE